VGTIDVLFSVQEDDRSRGGSLLAGAIAFRVFLWFLPAALLVAAGLGFGAAANPSDPARIVHDAGITSIAVQSINHAAQQAAKGRWFALVVGAVFLYTTSVGLVKALFVAHVLVWQAPTVKLAHKRRAVAELLALALALIAATAMASVIKHHSPGLGLTAMLAIVVVYGGAWWLYSLALPHGAAGRLDLIPGAVLFGVGAQVLHLVSVYYLAAKVSHASELYGGLGAAAAFIFGFYLVGRLIIGAAVINSAIFDHRHPTEPHPVQPRLTQVSKIPGSTSSAPTHRS
jgi:uncharacterized BrkB/YihY/UPF0761 family membrane protein